MTARSSQVVISTIGRFTTRPDLDFSQTVVEGVIQWRANTFIDLSQVVVEVVRPVLEPPAPGGWAISGEMSVGGGPVDGGFEYAFTTG